MGTPRQNQNSILENKFSEKIMYSIAQALLRLASDKAVKSEVPNISQYERKFMAALGSNNSMKIEGALVNLYAKLHSAGAKYSFPERELLNARSGYSCYAGGFSPIIRAEKFIMPESVVVDLGAGNGLQGLLFQYLYPHKKTIQIELSSEMIRVGKIMQQAFGIRDNLVEWVNDDIVNVPMNDMDFLYIYRPALPVNDGRKVYDTIARKLNDIKRPLVIFSIADCLAEFLDTRFSIFYSDGHLTCFSKD